MLPCTNQAETKVSCPRVLALCCADLTYVSCDSDNVDCNLTSYQNHRDTTRLTNALFVDGVANNAFLLVGLQNGQR